MTICMIYVLSGFIAILFMYVMFLRATIKQYERQLSKIERSEELLRCRIEGCSKILDDVCEFMDEYILFDHKEKKDD